MLLWKLLKSQQVCQGCADKHVNVGVCVCEWLGILLVWRIHLKESDEIHGEK